MVLTVTSPYDAVIFDFDGTLVDTMPMHFEAYRRTFAEIGITLRPEEYYSNVGGTAHETIPRFLNGRSSPWSVAEIHARKQHHVREVLDAEPVRQLATSALLPLLHGRVRMAVASSGSRPVIERIVERLSWPQYFDAIVTGADVTRGKPAPDLFCLAAKRVGVIPSRCLAFEDTDDGVESATRAMMSVVDVRRSVAASANLMTKTS